MLTIVRPAFVPHFCAALVAMLFATGCSRQLEAPPVEVLKRESLVGAGKIVQVRSTTDEILRQIEVTIMTDDLEMRHVEDELAGRATFEIGWKKLDGWRIPDSAEIEVRAAGYLLPYRAKLKPSGNGAGDGKNSP